jgi:hypothetical protein
MPGHIHNQIFLSTDLKTTLTICEKAAKRSDFFNLIKFSHLNCVSDSIKLNLITNRLVVTFGRNNSCYYQVQINLRPHENGTLIHFVDTSNNINYTDNHLDDFIRQFIETLGE